MSPPEEIAVRGVRLRLWLALSFFRSRTGDPAAVAPVALSRRQGGRDPIDTRGARHLHSSGQIAGKRAPLRS